LLDLGENSRERNGGMGKEGERDRGMGKLAARV